MTLPSSTGNSNHIQLTISAEALLKRDKSELDFTLDHLSANLLDETLVARLICLPPGRRTVPSAHSRSDLFYYVLSGSGICWLNGVVYEMGPNDCVGSKAGTGIAIGFINESESSQPLSFLLIGHKKFDDKVFYPLNSPSKLMLASSWLDPPSHRLGLHNGLPSHATTLANPPTERIWPNHFFHSLVMGIPNSLPLPESSEIAHLSLLASLSSSPGFSVTQTVLSPHSRAPAGGPRAHSKEDRIIYVCAAVQNGGGKIWLDGTTQDIETGTSVRLKAGTGISWSVINDGEDELIFLEIAEDVDDDQIYYPLVAADAASDAKAKNMVTEELGRTWWSDAPRNKIGECSELPYNKAHHIGSSL